MRGEGISGAEGYDVTREGGMTSRPLRGRIWRHVFSGVRGWVVRGEGIAADMTSRPLRGRIWRHVFSGERGVGDEGGEGDRGGMTSRGTEGISVARVWERTIRVRKERVRERTIARLIISARESARERSINNCNFFLLQLKIYIIYLNVWV